MLIAAALLLQAAAPPPAAPKTDSPYEAAARPWAECTRRHAVAAKAAPGKEEEAADAAFAACAAEEAVMRAEMVRQLGEEGAASMLPMVRDIARKALVALVKRQGA